MWGWDSLAYETWRKESGKGEARALRQNKAQQDVDNPTVVSSDMLMKSQNLNEKFIIYWRGAAQMWSSRGKPAAPVRVSPCRDITEDLQAAPIILWCLSAPGSLSQNDEVLNERIRTLSLQGGVQCWCTMNLETHICMSLIRFNQSQVGIFLLSENKSLMGR